MRSMLVIMLTAGVASAANLPQVPGEMKHALISFDGSSLSAHVSDLPDEPATDPVVLESYPGDAPYDAGGVLDGTYYSARYGWLAEGFISLPAGAAISITQIAATEGLRVYEGGMRPKRDMHTYAPIFGTEGSSPSWTWPGTMVHNWYAADAPGIYSADYTLSIVDATTGAPIPGFGSASVTFSFVAVPAPSASVLGLMGLGLSGRRRR